MDEDNKTLRKTYLELTLELQADVNSINEAWSVYDKIKFAYFLEV